MVWPGADGVPIPEPPAPKKSWCQPRWWWSIPGALIVVGAVVGLIVTGAQKPEAPSGHQAASSSSNGNTGSSGSGPVGESARESWRLLPLRGWSNAKKIPVPTRGA